MRSYSIGSICSFTKGASVPRDRMGNVGDYLYLHYGDLYKGHELYIDVEDPQKLIPFISRTERIHNNQFIDDGDIVYVLTSETIEDLGKALYLHNPLHRTVVAGTETTVMRILRKDLIHPAWLNYYIQTPRFKKILQQYATGMKVFRVNPRDISLIEIELPSLETQQRSIAILDTIHKKLRINNQINDYLEECARSLFRNYSLDNESLRKIAVRDFTLSMSNGATPSRKNDSFWTEGAIPWIKTGEVNNNLIFETEEHVTDLALNKTSIKLLPIDTVIIALYGSGTAGRVALLKTPATTNQACTAMVCDSPEKAFYLYLTLQDMYHEIDNLTRGSVQQNLSKDIVAELEIPLFSDETFSRLGIAEIYAQLSVNTLENIQLTKLRDALLPKLMSGEIDVANIELPTQLNNHLYECLA